MSYIFLTFTRKKSMILYTIKLLEEEVAELTQIINKGSHGTQSYRAAYILLNCDKGDFSSDKTIKISEICRILKITERTVERVKKRFMEEGLESVLERRPSIQTYTKKMDGDLEAKIITLCCSAPPKGFSQWSLRLLADKIVELGYVESISHVSVGNVLKKTNRSGGRLSLGKSKAG